MKHKIDIYNNLYLVDKSNKKNILQSVINSSYNEKLENFLKNFIKKKKFLLKTQKYNDKIVMSQKYKTILLFKANSRSSAFYSDKLINKKDIDIKINDKIINLSSVSRKFYIINKKISNHKSNIINLNKTYKNYIIKTKNIKYNFYYKTLKKKSKISINKSNLSRLNLLIDISNDKNSTVLYRSQNKTFYRLTLGLMGATHKKEKRQIKYAKQMIRHADIFMRKIFKLIYFNYLNSFENYLNKKNKQKNNVFSHIKLDQKKSSFLLLWFFKNYPKITVELKQNPLKKKFWWASPLIEKLQKLSFNKNIFKRKIKFKTILELFEKKYGFIKNLNNSIILNYKYPITNCLIKKKHKNFFENYNNVNLLLNKSKNKLFTFISYKLKNDFFFKKIWKRGILYYKKFIKLNRFNNSLKIMKTIINKNKSININIKKLSENYIKYLNYKKIFIHIFSKIKKINKNLKKSLYTENQTRIKFININLNDY